MKTMCSSLAFFAFLNYASAFTTADLRNCFLGGNPTENVGVLATEDNKNYAFEGENLYGFAPPAGEHPTYSLPKNVFPSQKGFCFQSFSNNPGLPNRFSFSGALKEGQIECKEKLASYRKLDVNNLEEGELNGLIHRLLKDYQRVDLAEPPQDLSSDDLTSMRAAYKRMDQKFKSCENLSPIPNAVRAEIVSIREQLNRVLRMYKVSTQTLRQSPQKSSDRTSP